MTTATINEQYVQFVTLVATSPELSRQLEAVSGSEDIIQLAAANGFIFSPEDLKNAAHETRTRMDQSGGELSEQDLESVAGGFPGFGKIVRYVRKAVDWIDNKVNGKK